MSISVGILDFRELCVNVVPSSSDFVNFIHSFIRWHPSNFLWVRLESKGPGEKHGHPFPRSNTLQLILRDLKVLLGQTGHTV